MSSSTALLAGATGLVGTELLDILLASPRHTKVVAVTRRYLDLTHDKLENHVVDFDHLETTLRAGVKEADEAYCALGTTIRKAGSKKAFRQVDFDYEVAFAQAALNAGVTRFALVSAVGADPESSVFYSRVKGETEEAIRALGFPSCHVFRPGILLGKRDETRPAEQLAAGLTPLLNLGLQGSLRKYRGIAARDVAKAMVSALATDGPGRIHTYDDIKAAAR